MAKKEELYKICFVILHYIEFDTTVNCIDSILENIKYSNYSIIIVDNGSPNQSGEALQQKYASEKNVEVIISDENLGFAKGNNLGYQAAKELYHADFIVDANNDILFKDAGFVNKIINIYNETECYLLGPDIITPEGMHQNPFRDHVLKYDEAKKKFRNRKIFMRYLKIKHALHIEDKIYILENLFDEKNDKVISEKKWDHAQSDVVLHGSCVIFTPLFLKGEDIGFAPFNFMYGEEDILADMCMRKGYKIFYSPNINVLHLGGASTKVGKNSAERIYFRNENMLKGLENLLQEMEKANKSYNEYSER